jgi:hypothetical protein
MKVAAAITFIALLIGIAWWSIVSGRRSPPGDQRAIDAKAEELVCITPQRVPVEFQRMTLCIAPPPDIGPHDVPEILVYANQIALEFRRKHPNNFDYPIGSRFVKHKFASRWQEAPDAATVMVRTASRGDVTDWEFSSLSLPDEKKLGTVNDRSCIECHQAFAERGFISHDTEGALRRHLQLD